MLPIRILATGKALPQRCVTASELDLRLGRPDGYVLKKSGVRRRFFAADTDSQSQLAGLALKDALRRGGIAPGSIDLLLGASGVPEQALPSTACRILEPAGLPAGVPAFDVNASCLGFVAALHVAANLLAGGGYRRIAVVAADLPSRGLDWDHAESSLIFGDGAAAVVVEKGDATQGCRAFRLETYPAGKSYCEIRAGGTRRNPSVGMETGDFRFRMDGKRVFRLASAVMEGFLQRLFAGLPYGRRDVDLVVPHQASHLSMQHLGRRLGLDEDAIVDIYADHGNQVAASIPTALHEAATAGRLKPGARVLLLGTAAGLSVGGMVLTL